MFFSIPGQWQLSAAVQASRPALTLHLESPQLCDAELFAVAPSDTRRAVYNPKEGATLMLGVVVTAWHESHSPPGSGPPQASGSLVMLFPDKAVGCSQQ